MSSTEADPGSIDALQKAVNDSATKASLLWTSFVALAAYLLIATGSVKHRDLFLGTSIKLPVLGVELPVTGYFFVAPLVLVIFHFYLVLQVRGLANKVVDYDRILKTALTSSADRRLMRHRLDDFPVLQLLAGVAEHRTGPGSVLLTLISWITIAIFPLIVLLQMQVVFLPYHHPYITWLHRVSIVFDLVIIGFFWWSVRRPTSRTEHVQTSSDATPELDRLHEETLGWRAIFQSSAAARRGFRILARRARKFWSRRHASAISLAPGIVAAALVLLFSLFLATYPGKVVYRNAMAYGVDSLTGFALGDRTKSVSRYLFEGDINDATGQPESLFSNRIILPGERFYDQEKGAAAEVSVSLRGRDLQGAVFQRADLRKADFAGAILIGALFTRANLKETRFLCPGRIVIEPNGRNQQKCNPELATDLRGADFTEASLHGADFDHAKLQGARFTRAMMQGSSFANADLTGASLSSARLEGASFVGARLLGVSFVFVQAQGADFRNADLSASAFLLSQLQGAYFSSATFANATFSRANLYRAFINPDKLQDTIFVSVSANDRFPQLRQPTDRLVVPPSLLAQLPERLDVAGYSRLLARAVEGAPEKARDLILERLKVLDPLRPADAAQWVRAQPISSPSEKSKSLREGKIAKLAELMCSADEAPFVARGLVNNGRILGAEMDGGQLIAKLRDPRDCPGTLGFSEDDFRNIRRIEAQVRSSQRRQQGGKGGDDDNDD